MRVVIKKEDVQTALALLKDCLAKDLAIDYLEKTHSWVRHGKTVAGFASQGRDYLSVGVFTHDELEDRAREMLASIAVRIVGELSLHGVDITAARKILLQRSDIDISEEPRYFLHQGCIEVVTYTTALTVSCFGGRDVLKHGVALLSLLQSSIK